MKLYLVRDKYLDFIMGIYTSNGLKKLKDILLENYFKSDKVQEWYSSFKSYFADNYEVRIYQVNHEVEY